MAGLARSTMAPPGPPPIFHSGPSVGNQPDSITRRLASVRYWYENAQPSAPSLPPLNGSISARYPSVPPASYPTNSAVPRTARANSLPAAWSLPKDGSPCLSGCREVVRGSKVVDIPSTRQVTTPVVRERIVNTTRKELVPTTRYVEEVEYVQEEETYMEYEERPCVRMKEVWVRQLVPETVYETIPVPRTRAVSVPRPVTRQVTTMVEVDVPAQEIVQEQCYQIEEVQEVAQAEVEVCQEVEWVPRIVAQWEEEGRLISDWRTTSHRTLGVDCAPTPNYRPAPIPALPPDPQYISAAPAPPTRPRLSPFRKLDAVPRQPGSSLRSTVPLNASMSMPLNTTMAAPSDYPSVMGMNGSVSAPQSARIHVGLSLLKVRGALVVKDVAPGGLAEAAGLQQGDVVVAIDGVPVASHEEFQAQIRGKGAFEVEAYDEGAQQYFRRVISAEHA